METSRELAAESTRQEVREVVGALIGLEPSEMEDDANLVHLGLSSLDVMRISSRWRRAGTPVDFDTLVAGPTVGGWALHLEEVRSRAAAAPDGAA
ncbi:phosphopantetheine-binding protein [Streptomyces sp. NPDC005551]|uniref:phosphopantetheine-binding protein n=1 Tax=unclassified Streptomyces TaxID=2593676 RepID=UPI003406305C